MLQKYYKKICKQDVSRINYHFSGIKKLSKALIFVGYA